MEVNICEKCDHVTFGGRVVIRGKLVKTVENCRICGTPLSDGTWISFDEWCNEEQKIEENYLDDLMENVNGSDLG